MKEFRPRAKSSKYALRMFMGGVVGFTLFALLATMCLYFADRLGHSWNPYLGAPPLMAVLVAGFFGLVIGAIAGLFKR